jgi:uncharacterized protein (DUF1501 family)
MKRSRLTRRALLFGSGAMASALSLGWRPARAAVAERKFLFLFASGAWDTTQVFDPHYDSGGVDMDPETYAETVGGITYAAGLDQPSVSRFFERWSQRACVINGLDTHSVGHDSATQFLMTGTSASSYPDWGTALAANARNEYPLPHVVFSGPSFGGNDGAAVVRAGAGTLLDLLDGSIVGASDLPTARPQMPADSMVDAFVMAQAARFEAGRTGNAAERAQAWSKNLLRAAELEGRQFEAGLDDLGSSLGDQCVKAAELMRLGLSRCAMIGIPGGWDSHGDNTVQGPQFEELFAALDALMDHLTSTPGQTTPLLADEVTIVCLSEFGRTPLLNGSGKDHWPYGSAMIVGSGVKGGQMVGRTDDELIAEPTDLVTGQQSSSGDIIAGENLGAALLQMGGLDPAAFLPDVAVLEAVVA